MSRKRHSAEEVVNKLRQADVELAKGSTIAAMCKVLGITDQTYFRWRKEYGGLKVDQARRFKELEQENARLKRVVAEQALDMRQQIGPRTRQRKPARLALEQRNAELLLERLDVCAGRRLREMKTRRGAREAAELGYH